eukprot:tig00020995_g16913.t1
MLSAATARAAALAGAAAPRIASSIAPALARTLPSLAKRLMSAKTAGLKGRGSLFSPEREPQHVFKPANEIIRAAEIDAALERAKALAKDESVIRDILGRARDRALLKDHGMQPLGGGEYVQGLTVEEAAILLQVDSNNQELMQMLYDTAFAIKNLIYGNRIVLFAPLYIANYCVNSCTYCSFRAPNTSMPRAVLTDEELRQEVEALQRMGHRRLLLLTGESPRYTFDQFLNALKIASEVRTDPCGSIRRINVEIPSLSVSDFRRLKETNCVGTYTLFQESYHPETYARAHPAGPKSDYEWRVQTMDRAQTAHVDDVGVGVLYGLHDYKWETLAMLQHAQHLDQTYGAGPHTVSIPRMQPAEGAPDAMNIPHPVNDEDFKKLVAVIRCAVPYTGMILSTRENPEMRRQLLRLGVSQMSAGSKTDVGSYHQNQVKPGAKPVAEHEHFTAGPEPSAQPATCTPKEAKDAAGQFTLQDHRSLDDVVGDLLELGFVPSWCTACYRKGRTGEAFMKIAKKGDIQALCHPNALLTLEEYLIDYASERTREIGKKVLEVETGHIPSERAKHAFERKLKKIDEGQRDLYF